MPLEPFDPRKHIPTLQAPLKQTCLESFLTLSSPNFFEVSQSRGGGGAKKVMKEGGGFRTPLLNNFLNFIPNLMKL